MEAAKLPHPTTAILPLIDKPVNKIPCTAATLSKFKVAELRGHIILIPIPQSMPQWELSSIKMIRS